MSAAVCSSPGNPGHSASLTHSSNSSSRPRKWSGTVEVAKLAEDILSGNLQAISAALVNPMFGGRKPIDGWSAFNRAIVFSRGTSDARGIRQWNAVGRKVKKGAKAIRILVPITKITDIPPSVDAEVRARARQCCDNCEVVEKILERWMHADHNLPSEECKECEHLPYLREILLWGKKSCKKVIVGFRGACVFAVEDTEGEPLEEEELPEFVRLNLKPVAEKLGVKVVPTDSCVLVVWRKKGKRAEVHGDVHPFVRAIADAVSAREFGEIDPAAASLAAAAITAAAGGRVIDELLDDFREYVRSLRSWTGKMEDLNIPDAARILKKIARADVIVQRIAEMAGVQGAGGQGTVSEESDSPEKTRENTGEVE